MNLLSQSDLVNSVRQIQRAGSDLKLLLFRSHLKGETAWKPSRDEYISKVYSFINTWKEYARDLQDGMKHASGSEGINSIKQNAVRNYIYCNYDYASILPYVDGVFRAIKKNEFDNPRDFEDFWKYTVQKAFKGRSDSIGGLVEEVLSLQSDFSGYQSSIADAKMFDAVKHQQIFKPTDSRDLYKSIEKAIEFIFYSDDDGKFNYPEGEMMQIAVVNSIVDYATYALTAYATRIYAVALYANPFIQNAKGYSEAADTFGPKVGVFRAMKETDEGMARDFRRLPEYVDHLQKFLTEIGAHDSFEDARDDLNNPGARWRAEINSKEGNLFNAALMSNPIKELIFGYLGMAWVQELEVGKRLHQVGDVLRDCLYNGRVAYGDTSTPKNELLAAIARVKPEKKTLESFQKLGSDLVKFCGAMLYSIYDLIRSHIDHEVIDPKSYWEKKGSLIRDEQEIVNMLNDLYKDIAVALLYRARAIEEKINYIRISDRAEMEDRLTIKVPGGLHRKGNGLAHAMAPIVPVTQRIPMEVLNLYSTPYADKLNLYDEYAKTLLPGDSYYFTEDGEESWLTKFINWIKSLFNGACDAIARFSGNASFKAAAEWVKKHRSELDSLEPVPPITVKPYVEKIQIGSLSSQMDYLKTHVTKETLTDKTKFETFKTELYRDNPALLALKNNKELGTDKVALAYKNHLLFGVEIAPSAAEEVAEKELNNPNEIKRYLKGWVTTLVDAPDVLNKFHSLMTNYKNTVDDLINKCNSWHEEIQKEGEKKPEGEGASSDKTDKIEAEPVNTQSKSGDRGVSNETTVNGMRASEIYNLPASFDFSSDLFGTNSFMEDGTAGTHDLYAEVLKELREAIELTVIPAYQSLSQAIRDEYKYIQEIYYAVKGKKEEKSE